MNHQQESDMLWQQIGQYGEELAKELENEIGEITEFIEKEIAKVSKYWRLITLV